MIDLDAARASLPLPKLMEQFGHGEKAKKKALCPFHDDNTPSFSVFQNGGGRWQWKCHAGCGNGDEVTFVMRSLACNDGEAIRHYGHMAGISDSNNTMNEDQFKALAKSTFQATESKPEATQVPTNKASAESEGRTLTAPPSPAPTRAELVALGAKTMAQVAKWRGLSQELIQWMSDKGLIGKFNGQVAFPVTGGVHYRKEDGSWRYSEGAKPDLFTIGDLEEGAPIHCFESQWDAMTYAESSGERDNICATRGAANVKLLTDKLKGHTGTLYLWPQNDEPGKKWADDIAKALPGQQLKLVKICGADTAKDLNEWHRDAGATSGDVFNAVLDAKNLTAVPVLAEPQSNRSPSDDNVSPDGFVSGEARESTTGSLIESGRSRMTADSRGGSQEFNDLVERVAASMPDEYPTGMALALAESVATAAEPSPEKAETPTKKVEEPSGEVATGTVAASASSEPITSSPTPLAKTLDKLVAFVKRYVVFTHDEQADAIALWIAHAWTFESFRFTPYLNINSPEKRCGKTRLLECLQSLTPKPQSFVRPSEPVLFRTIEKQRPTLLLDEIDTIYNSSRSESDERSEGIRAVLNAGFQSGPFAFIPRCIGKDHEPKLFNTFCPKVIAGIGKNLPDTVRDRSIEIRLVRQLEGHKAERFRAADVEVEVAPLKAELEAWAKSATDELSKARPTMPSQLQDRQQDMMEPLFAIADMAGGEWPEKARESLVALGASHTDTSTNTRLLADCRQIFNATSQDRLTTTTLLEYLTKIENADSPWPTWWENDLKRGNTGSPARKLAKLLKEFNIEPHTIRLTDKETAKGYHKIDFYDAWKRYLEPEGVAVTAELAF